mgnify:CR=1 FL=1
MHHVGALKSINEEDGGSISWSQQMGTKRGATIDISQDLLASPQTIPNPTPENYKEVHVRLGGDCQCVQ